LENTSVLRPLVEILKEYWGYDTFLPLQREAMESVLEGRDSLVVLPTGGGKSLCFQAPALALPGMAVVVSPLISLMKDQVDSLIANGVNAIAFNSSMRSGERERAEYDIARGAVKLLYVSPERLVIPAFVSLLEQAGVSFIVVDEAHCISHWGHDFRPEYRELSRLRQIFPKASVHAYTATATDHVRNDIISELQLRDPRLLIGSFDRPNLTYGVERRTDPFGQVRAVIEDHAGESGIVYCIRRAEVDALCDRLVENGFKALPYHAGMDERSRKENQDAFAKDEVDIIVATIAFGMGIDKSNVRYVIHAGMPKSIEHYLQESGRAGRDGLPSDCRLFYSFGDFKAWKSFIDKTEGDAQTIALKKLEDMLRFCDSGICRHKALVEYFGEPYKKESCDACDICNPPQELTEGTEEAAKAILGCVAELGGMAGPTYTSLILTGSREDRVTSKGHHRLNSYGLLSEFDARTVRDWIEQLASRGYLEKTGEYNILVPTERGQTALNGLDAPKLIRPQERVQRTRKSRERAMSDAPLNRNDEELFEALRALRRQIASEMGVPPFIVFGDATLVDMARKKPKTTLAFLGVHGVGGKKSRDYADRFLSVIRQRCGDAEEEDYQSEESFEEAAPAKKPKRSGKDSQKGADALFDQGRSIEEVAEILERAPSTVWTYLWKYLAHRRRQDPSPWVSPHVFERVCAVIDEIGSDRLAPIHQKLDDEISYEDIRACIACRKNK
jgi:ATP-dependent DNA helicase RecQ